MKKTKTTWKKSFRFSKAEKRTIIAARRKGLTYAQLLKKFGVHQPTVYRWMSG